MKRLLALAILLTTACERSAAPVRETPEPNVELTEKGMGVAPSAPIAAPAWYGVWAADEKDCGAAPGFAEDAPIAFTANEFLGYGNRCRIGAAEEGTEGGWRIALLCMIDDVERVQITELDVDGSMLRMNREGEREIVLMRCEEEE